MSQPDPTPGSQEEARRKVKAAFLHPGRGQIWIALALAILGFAAVIQVRVSGQDDAYETMRQADLIQMLNGFSAASRRAEQDIAGLEKTRDKLRSTSAGRQAALDQATAEAQRVAILAGTSPAEGPGIRVTIEDPNLKISAGHVLDAIEELRDAGAESIEFNDRVRVVATSFVSADPAGLKIDGVRLTAPYTITAIGDPATLAGGLTVEQGFVDKVLEDDSRIKAKVSKEKSVRIDSVIKPPKPSYAKPADSR
ncbi:MAG TPA: DUF881 domain-containing protein [Marmoricola sp.]|jgi:uncharacterized protein YlxW (UPF0749 family)|nr:DUF881 domain-containing protein [Nocardioidaceae bacterium]MCB8992513.1 DUF881 domain-containing protein [Nocardioidaceae bacterium]MCO5323605.1 DUF881 domain-containing protein [Nocardioidaceae bacterium]HRV67844.1 DUF881 domain-containing protein [Marmoricola sp.]